MSRIYLGRDPNTDNYNEWVLLWNPAAHHCSASFYLKINKNNKPIKKKAPVKKDSK